jgi:hypothetical protein
MIGLAVMLRPSANSVALASSPKLASASETYDDHVYDYVILLDRSGSMLAGEPTLFSTLRDTIVSYVDDLPTGAVPMSMKVYTFSDTIDLVGAWSDLDQQTAREAKNKLKAIVDPIPLADTALWDAINLAMDELEISASNDQRVHYKKIVVFTDGKDTASQLTQEEVMARYEGTIEKDGNLVIFEYCINECTIPFATGVPGGGKVPTPRDLFIDPIRLTSRDDTLGKDGAEELCINFWFNDETVTELDLKIGMPNPETNLPTNVSLQVCKKGTNCERSVQISEAGMCLDFKLINFSYQNMTPDDFGQYTISVPVEVDAPDAAAVNMQPGHITLNLTIPAPREGCMDPEAIHYDELAEKDDGSCTYWRLGCTDPEAINYDELAEKDDGSCTYWLLGCTDPEAKNHDPFADKDDGSCTYWLLGCTDPEAKNHDPFADKDDGSCTYWRLGCMDPQAENYDPLAEKDDGSCEYPPVVINCSGEALIDLGTFDSGQTEFKWLRARERVVKVGECLLEWGNAHPSSTMTVEVEPDDNDNPTKLMTGSGSHLWLERNGEQADSLLLTPADEHILIASSLDDTLFEQLEPGEHLFLARILLDPAGVSLQGDVATALAAPGWCEGPDAEPPCIKVQFTAKVRRPFWPFLAGGTALLILGFLVTRPRFPSDAQVRIDGFQTTWLADAQPRNWRSGTIIIGEGPDAAIELNNVEGACLKLEPSWDGSWLGRRLFRKIDPDNDVLCTLRLNNCFGQVSSSTKQQLIDGELLRLGSASTAMTGDKLTVTYGNSTYQLEFIRAADETGYDFFESETASGDNPFE